MAAVIRMPEIATGAEEAGIQVWLVHLGDEVAVDQPLVEIETDKAVVEYLAEESGTLAGILVEAGQSARVGAPIAVLAASGESAEQALAEAGIAGEPSAGGGAPPAASEPTAVVSPPSTPVAAATDGPSPAPRLFASPLVRRLARERGIDLAMVTGSGPKGRIVRRDLAALLEPTPRETPVVMESAPSGPGRAAAAPAAIEGTGFDDIPHSGMRRAIARRLTESKSTIPHFYLAADCRVDALVELRRRINETPGTKISMNDLVVKAVAWAMRDVPEANAIWTEAATRRFEHVDIAVAVSVPDGLLTPVVRGVDRLSVGEVSTTIRDLAGRARQGKLKQQELEGGSFSVSNLGMYGTREFTAIINPPHSGILAVGSAIEQPVVAPDGSLTVGRVMRVTLSADHRVIDGALAAQWLAAFTARMGDPVSILV
ncbi:MAG: dihydrolipoamide acetyltransferase family protein [Propioniciclava sp.]